MGFSSHVRAQPQMLTKMSWAMAPSAIAREMIIARLRLHLRRGRVNASGSTTMLKKDKGEKGSFLFWEGVHSVFSDRVRRAEHID